MSAPKKLRKLDFLLLWRARVPSLGLRLAREIPVVERATGEPDLYRPPPEQAP